MAGNVFSTKNRIIDFTKIFVRQKYLYIGKSIKMWLTKHRDVLSSKNLAFDNRISKVVKIRS